MILFGASGHCKVILDALSLNGIEVDYIIDDNPRATHVFGIEVMDNQVSNEHLKVIISVGNNMARKKIATKYLFNYQVAKHSSAVVSEFSKIGRGTVVLALAAVNAAAVIGEHCIINTGAIIEHDCVIKDFVHISPNASLAGNVHVGEGSHIGIGACVIQGVNIGKWCTVGAGSVIISDIPDYCTVVGNPGRIIKTNSL